MKMRFSWRKSKQSIVLIVQHLDKKPQETIADCLDQHWDQKTRMITDDHPDFEWLYPYMMDIKVRGKMILRTSINDPILVLKKLLQVEDQDPDLVKWLDVYVADYKSRAGMSEKSGNIKERNRLQGHADHYHHARNKIAGYMDVSTYSNINRSWAREYRTHLLADESLKDATRLSYLKRAKTSYIKMIRALELKDQEPFKDLTIEVTRRSYEQRKKRLQDDPLKKLAQLDLQGNFKLARDMFLVLFDMGGCDLADFYFLKKTDFVDGRMYMDRSKVRGSAMDLLVTARVREFLEIHTSDDQYLLPWRKDVDGYRNWRNNLRRQLKLVGERNEIVTVSGAPLGWKVARHTFASRAKELGIDGDLLRELMGHRRNEIDNYYKDAYPQKVRDAAQLKVADLK
jgi:hypothetical protein